MIFNHNHYTPCLRWKQGEYQAVLELSSETKKKITPLIEIPELGWDFKEKKQMKTVDQLLEPFAKRVCTKWGNEFCFIDVMKNIKSSDRMENGTHPVKFAFDKLRERKSLAIPVIGLDKEEEHLKAIKEILKKDKRGVCFRVKIEEAAKKELKNNLDFLKSYLEIEVDNCDLILDLGAPNFLPIEGLVKIIQGIFTQLPYLNGWRTVSIIGTSFPETMAVVKRGIDVIQRYEWQLYKELVDVLRMKKKRIPTFGDYTINHPTIILVDMRIVKPSASIRYTVSDKWVIVKGTNYREDPEQYIELSKRLVKTKYYCGKDFSFGDDYIFKCAVKQVSYGNLTTWRKVGTNHHIEKLSHDIANHFA